MRTLYNFIILIAISAVPVRATCVSTVTSPTASQVIGNTARNRFLLTSTQVGCVSLYSVQYLLDGIELMDVARTPPYSYDWTPYFTGNGVHTFTAVARDAQNNILATSPAITFSVEDDLPQNNVATNCTGAVCTDITVTTGSVSRLTIPGALNWGMSVASFQGAGAVTVVGSPVTNGAGGASTMNLVSAATAGNLFAVAGRVQNSGQTISVSDSRNGAYTCNTVAPDVAGGFATQWCYVKNIATGSTTITLTSSGGGSILQGYAFQLAGASTTTPADIVGAGNAFGVNQLPTSAQFNLASTNELILAFGSWQGSGQTAAAGPGYTVYQESAKGSAVETIAPGFGWFSTMAVTATVNGTHSTISKSIAVAVDGLSVGTPIVGTSPTAVTIVDTTNFENTSSHPPHTVVVTVLGGNCPGCTNGNWSSMGVWEQQFSFTNGALPSWLQSSADEVTLCTTSLTNCPTTTTLTGTIVNTDGSTTAGTVTCGSGNTAVVTVTGSCTLNSTSTTGSALITMTETGGEVATFWANNLLANTLPHFLKNGTVSTTYIPGQSIWLSSLFTSLFCFNPLGAGQTSSFNYAAQCGSVFSTGFNTVEDSPVAPTSYGSAAAFISAVLADLTAKLNFYAPYNVNIHLIADSYFRGNIALFQTMYGLNATWGPGGIGPWQYVVSQWAGHAIGISMVDETTTTFGNWPMSGIDTSGIKLGTSYLSDPISCVSNVCTAHTANMGLTANNNFIIHGSGDANLDYNTSQSSPAPLPYHASQGFGTFTFTAAGVGTKNFTQLANPGLILEPQVDSTFGASPTFSPCPGGGGGGSYVGPCSNFNPYNVFKDIRTQTQATTGYPAVAWPARAGTTTTGISNWCGQTFVAGVNMADYCEAYWSGGSSYLPTKYSLQSEIKSGELDNSVLSLVYPYMNTQTPLIYEGLGTSNDFAFNGYPIAITSCLENTITTSVPHGLKKVLPEVTRLYVIGSSGALCDGSFYVMAAPTATTLQVLKANNSGPGSTTGATLTFQDGTQFTGPQPFTQVSGSNQPSNFNAITGMTCAQFKSKRGQTFKVTNGNSTYLQGMLGGWISGANANTGCGNNQTPWRELANFAASTGGNVFIIADNYYHQGTSWQFDSNSGPEAMFASTMSALIGTGAGVRTYGWNVDTQLCDPTLAGTGVGNCFADPTGNVTGVYNPQFASGNLGGNNAIQGHLNAFADVANSQIGFVANSTANLLAQRLVPYAFQQRLASPSYGKGFKAAIRTGSLGNLLMIQAYADNSVSCTADLTRINGGGQMMYRFSATWSGIEPIVAIAANTASDTMLCAPGEFRAYIAPVQPGSELSQPTVTPNIADVTNAVKVIVQFSYSPLVFSSGSVRSQILFQTFDCLASHACVLPVDRNIGTIYYRYQFLGSSNEVLATYGVETI